MQHKHVTLPSLAFPASESTDMERVGVRAAHDAIDRGQLRNLEGYLIGNAISVPNTQGKERNVVVQLRASESAHPSSLRPLSPSPSLSLFPPISNRSDHLLPIHLVILGATVQR